MDGFPWKIPFKWMIWRWPHFSKPPNEQYKGMCIILLESLYFMGHKCLMFWQDLQLSWSLARHWFASQWCSQSEDFEGRHLVQTPGGRMIRASLNHFCQLIGIPSHCGKKTIHRYIQISLHRPLQSKSLVVLLRHCLRWNPAPWILDVGLGTPNRSSQATHLGLQWDRNGVEITWNYQVLATCSLNKGPLPKIVEWY